MARNGDRDGICRAGCGDGSNRTRGIDSFRDLRVAGGGSSRDFTQCLPDALLEDGASKVEREVEPPRRQFKKSGDLGQRAQPILAMVDEPSMREISLQFGDEQVGSIMEKNRADPDFGRSREHPSEQAFPNAKVNPFLH
jgi:hypothetical protein